MRPNVCWSYFTLINRGKVKKLLNISSLAVNTSGDKSLTTGKDQVLSCTITSLDAAATVKWIDPAGSDVPTNDPTNYIVVDGSGTYSSSTNSQTTQLTIKAAKMATISTAATYKCSVTSGQYSTSPASETSITITPIGTSFVCMHIQNIINRGKTTQRKCRQIS